LLEIQETAQPRVSGISLHDVLRGGRNARRSPRRFFDFSGVLGFLRFIRDVQLKEDPLNKIQNSLPAAPVGLQLIDKRFCGAEAVPAELEVPHDLVIGVPEALDRLFRVPDEKKTPALAQRFLDERLEGGPLHRGRVLELIDEVMENPVAETDIDVGNNALV
jgi:hypothetical protein